MVECQIYDFISVSFSRGPRPLYESHFGLSPFPFSESSDPRDFVLTASRESALHRLRYGLEHGQGPALMYGAPGAGKTILARKLARDLGGPSIHLTFPAMPAEELLEFLADELSAPPAARPGLAGSVRRVRSTLAAMAMRGVRPLLIVDEAHLIEDPAAFEALRLLLNFTSNGPPDVSILLVGGAEVLSILPPAFADRLASRVLLGPLTESESVAYISGRLALAGATGNLFDRDALALLHRAADGLPRRLNRLADLALLISYADGRPSPDRDAVEIAVREAGIDLLAA